MQVSQVVDLKVSIPRTHRPVCEASGVLLDVCIVAGTQEVD